MNNNTSRSTGHWPSPVVLNLVLFCCALLICCFVNSLTPCDDFLCISKIRAVFMAATGYPLLGAWLNGYLFHKYRLRGAVLLTFLFTLLFLCMLFYWLLLLF